MNKRTGSTMANDRLYIKCKTCGKEQMLAKFYPLDPGIGPITADGGKITRFLLKHMKYCHPRRRKMDMGGDPGFVLHTEEAPAGELAKAIGDAICGDA